MSNAAMRWTSPGRLAAVPLAALAGLLAFREVLGIAADPLRLIGACFAAMAVLLVVDRHPAAFIAPVLFLPRLKEVSALGQFGPAGRMTALGLACGLLAVGVFLRWISNRQQPGPSEAADGTGFLPVAERRSLLPSSPVATFLLFAAVVALSYFYSPAPHYGTQKLIAFATLGCGLFFASFLLFTGEGDFRDFTFGTALFAMVVAASSLSFSATGAMGAEDNPAHIGKGQVIGLAILLLLYTPVKHPWLRRIIVFLCIPALAIGLVSAETRGPLFSLLLVLMLSLFLESFRSPMISRRQMVFAGAALVGAVMLLSTFWFYGAEAFKFQYKADEIVNLIEGDNQAQGTAVERLVFYRAALDLSTQHPVFGYGLGGWSMAYLHVDDRNYPHNLFCEVLVEQGLVGVAALLLFLRAVFRNLRAHRTLARTYLPCLLPVLVYLISIAMFSGDLDDDRFIWFWCGLTVAGCALLERIHTSGSNADREDRIRPVPGSAINPAA
jgi:O-antigen ligase